MNELLASMLFYNRYGYVVAPLMPAFILWDNVLRETISIWLPLKK